MYKLKDVSIVVVVVFISFQKKQCEKNGRNSDSFGGSEYCIREIHSTRIATQGKETKEKHDKGIQQSKKNTS